MRYLKMFALDLNANHVPDIVYLEFHDPRFKRSLRSRATAFDVNEQGLLHWVVADDVNNDGEQSWRDDYLAMNFAQQFIAFKWFGAEQPYEKYLKVSAEEVDVNRGSGIVRLQFYQGDCTSKEGTLIERRVCYLEGFDKGGHLIEETPGIRYEAGEAERIISFGNSFLKFNWHEGVQPVPPLMLPASIERQP